jgi:predicted nucleotidyltransferase
MNVVFTQKMKGVCEDTVKKISNFFEDKAIEAHVFGSMAKGTNDALSDIDIWITFKDSKIENILRNRMDFYSNLGEIVIWHEMQNNFPLDGIQTAVIYKIEGELIRVDFYLCPFSSSRVLPGSKILFEKVRVEVGDIIPETKRIRKDLSDRITFFVCMCFNGIKKVVRKDKKFMDFLFSEFQKYENDIPELMTVPKENNFETIKKSLCVLAKVSNEEQKKAILDIGIFLEKVERIVL